MLYGDPEMALIDIGSQKQLFVDDYLIESMSNCVRTMNRAERWPLIRCCGQSTPGKGATSS